MTAPIVLKSEKFVSLQRSLILSRLNRLLYKIFVNTSNPTEDELALFWVKWPKKRSGAHYFGRIFRMK